MALVGLLRNIQAKARTNQPKPKRFTRKGVREEVEKQWYWWKKDFRAVAKANRNHCYVYCGESQDRYPASKETEYFIQCVIELATQEHLTTERISEFHLTDGEDGITHANLIYTNLSCSSHTLHYVRISW